MTARCFGVDGARGGWVAAYVDGEIAGAVELVFHTTFASILELAGPDDIVVVDIPVGLSADGHRPVDALVRDRLGPRRSTFFPTPVRSVLNFDDYADANAHSKQLTGKGLSKQAWNLLAKIAEVDAAWTPDLADRLLEGHPETSFAEMAGAPVMSKKATPEGRADRVRLLRGHIGAGVSAALEPLPKKWCTDAVDALALAWTANRVRSGTSVALGGDLDPAGRPMRLTI